MLFELDGVFHKSQNGDVFGFLHRLLTPPEAVKPRIEARLTQLENQYDDIDSRLDYLISELKKVRGRQFALEKARQDPAEEDISSAASVDNVAPRARPVTPTAFLARRFKGG